MSQEKLQAKLEIMDAHIERIDEEADKTAYDNTVAKRKAVDLKYNELIKEATRLFLCISQQIQK